MADGLRSLRWRAAILVAGAILVVAWVFLSGRASYLVQIDFSMGPMLEGALVEIDGDSVGTLQRYGRSQLVTGFQVEGGEHTVRVSMDDCEGELEAVTLSATGARRALLMAEMDDGYTCRVVLR